MKNTLSAAILLAAITIAIYVIASTINKIRKENTENQNTTKTKLMLMLILSGYTSSIFGTWINIAFFKDIHGENELTLSITFLLVAALLYKINKSNISKKFLIYLSWPPFIASSAAIIILTTQKFVSPGPGLITFFITSLALLVTAIKYRPPNSEIKRLKNQPHTPKKTLEQPLTHETNHAQNPHQLSSKKEAR